jgi:hypothetical protein
MVKRIEMTPEMASALQRARLKTNSNDELIALAEELAVWSYRRGDTEFAEEILEKVNRLREKQA